MFPIDLPNHIGKECEMSADTEKLKTNDSCVCHFVLRSERNCACNYDLKQEEEPVDILEWDAVK